MNEYLEVGVVAGTHGVHGEMKVFPTTDDPTRFDELKEVTLDIEGINQVLVITQVKHLKKFVVLKIEGIDDPNQVMAYRNKSLYVSRRDAVELEEDEYYAIDLIGLEVITDDGRHLGSLEDIISTGANDVYQVNDGKRKWYLPAIKECILDIALDDGKIIVHLMDGLEEL